ncbi:FHA domain-containing protein [Mariniblastus fucicola]|uniref:FHA domain-containing protein FhaB n=1 Tax=Mariniblastus fucicola TaxID=980251 RepID=A0A5B9PC37_9BACT|nr:FHA domain-containing protein [Mariniblastus fucicola]QEG20723.1 FHA domain-containing protein FhaB [Mariniblastus fucicola]
MQVVLRVVGGKHNGREIKLAVPKFIIGRGEGAHLRPSSDLVSRHHCGISVTDGQVIVEDLGSRNGTFVNGEQLSGPHNARSGDTIRIGRLQFELVMDPARSAKKAKVTNVVEAAARTATASKEGIEDSISDWLENEVAPPTESRAETVQFSMEETQTIFGPGAEGREQSSGEIVVDQVEQDSQELKKKGKGKLPPIPKVVHENSKIAADEALKKFFNRR